LRFLQRAIAQDSLGHAILLVGPESIGKQTLALDLAAALLCSEQPGDPCWNCRECNGLQRAQHPDFHLVELTEGRKSIRMEQIGALQQAVALKPYQAPQRVSTILEAHLLQPEAGQRLLKTLEEPPPHNTLILTATSSRLLPQTLVSRCQMWRLAPLPRSLVQSALERRGVAQQDALFLASASLGRLGWAIQASEDPELREQEEAIVQALIGTLRADRAARAELVEELLNEVNDVDRLFDLWSEWWRYFLLAQAGAPQRDSAGGQALGDEVDISISLQEIVGIVKRIDETREWVRANVNARLALETLVLHLPQAA
jgi:DNA polymerase-3 subunit delta'